MKFTDQQERVFSAGTETHRKIIAGAGSGKTTTLVELQKRTRRRALYCPFNRTIAEEATGKFLGSNCQVKTLHAFAWNAVKEPGQRPHQGGASDVRAGGHIGRVMFPRVRGWGDYRLAAAVNRTVSKFCVSDSPRMTEEHAREAIMESVGDPETLRDEKVRMRAEETLAQLSAPILAAARSYLQSLIDDRRYTHDVYLKLLDLSAPLLRTAFAGFQVVYKDEAQDSNPVETAILMKSGIPVISVGDPYQQLYSWRGAQNALDKLPGDPLFLTESFRFGPLIAEQAMAVLNALPVNVPDYPLIGAGDDKGRGRPSNAVICRTNAGVLDAAIAAAKRGHSYFVDNAESLVSDLKAAEAFREGAQARGVFAPFAHWDEAVAEAEAGDRTLDRLIRIVEEGRTDSVIRVIDKSMTSEKDAELTLMTAHRSKGREFPFVKLGDDWKPLSEMKKRWKKARNVSQRDETLALEEYNALYVAITRAESKVYGLAPLLDMDSSEPNPS